MHSLRELIFGLSKRKLRKLHFPDEYENLMLKSENAKLADARRLETEGKTLNSNGRKCRTRFTQEDHVLLEKKKK